MGQYIPVVMSFTSSSSILVKSSSLGLKVPLNKESLVAIILNALTNQQFPKKEDYITSLASAPSSSKNTGSTSVYISFKWSQLIDSLSGQPGGMLFSSKYKL